MKMKLNDAHVTSEAELMAFIDQMIESAKTKNQGPVVVEFLDKVYRPLCSIVCYSEVMKSLGGDHDDVAHPIVALIGNMVHQFATQFATYDDIETVASLSGSIVGGVHVHLCEALNMRDMERMASRAPGTPTQQ